MTFERTFTVGKNRATMALSDAGKFKVTWSPHMPTELKAPELAHYLSARNAIISEMSVALAANDCVLRPYRRAAWTESMS